IGVSGFYCLGFFDFMNHFLQLFSHRILFMGDNYCIFFFQGVLFLFNNMGDISMRVNISSIKKIKHIILLPFLLTTISFFISLFFLAFFDFLINFFYFLVIEFFLWEITIVIFFFKACWSFFNKWGIFLRE